MIGENTIVRARAGNISVDLDSETVILDTASGTYFGVNEVGRAIWEFLAEPRPVQRIRDVVVARFDVEPDGCLSDVVAFLTDLLSAGLVELDGDSAS